jgi:hypothetical protein
VIWSLITHYAILIEGKTSYGHVSKTVIISLTARNLRATRKLRDTERLNNETEHHYQH